MTAPVDPHPDPVEIVRLAVTDVIEGACDVRYWLDREDMLPIFVALEAAGFRIVGPEPTLKMLLAAVGQPHNVVFQKMHAAAPLYGR